MIKQLTSSALTIVEPITVLSVVALGLILLLLATTEAPSG